MNEKTIDGQETLSVEEVEDVLKAFDYLEFTKKYHNSYYTNVYSTPDLVNRQMKDITMNPVLLTTEGLERALSDVNNSENILRRYSQTLVNQNMYYRRLISYIADMPSFNLTFDVYNLKEAKELNSKEYKNDLDILDDFCTSFDYKEQFEEILKQVARNGVFYGILRQDGRKYVLQELPPDRCKITGRTNYGLIFDFDMNYFLGNSNTNINMFPPVFKRMFNNTFNHKGKIEYDPSMNALTRGSMFPDWHRCKPLDGFWAFKTDIENATIVPHFAPLFPDMALQPIVRNLQTDKYFIEASKLLVGIIGYTKENKNGKTTNGISISPEVLGDFLGTARKGLAKQIGLTALPMEEIKAVEFDTKERNMSVEHNKNIGDQSVASSAPLLDNTKLNVHQSKTAQDIDMNFIRSLYRMFENFIEYFVNAKTEKYKFKITFHDYNSRDDRSENLTKLEKQIQMGIVNYQDIARINDMDIFEFKRSLLISDSFKLDSKLKSIVNILNPIESTVTKESIPVKNKGIEDEEGLVLDTPIKGKRGRKPNPNSDNDNTANSTSRGTNELKE